MAMRGSDRAGDRAPLAVSLGDPAGIGPDIVVTAAAASVARELPPFVVHGDPEVLAERAAALGLALPLRVVADASELQRESYANPGALPVIAARAAEPVVAGRPNAANAAAVIQAIECAVADVVAGRAAAVVTCPIAKSVQQAAGFRHPGHTEFLGALAERHHPGTRARPVMMLASDELRVVPATVHIPLAAVPAALTRDLLRETIVTTEAALRADFGLTRPRIAVTGLNPHAGESGTMGREDADVIAPVVAELAALGLAVSGPYPADTLFHAAARARYDAVVAMYHDQALIPLKTLAFDTGVNVTLGLPFVRTSPDHGTAFDIAASGRASPESFIAALRLADAMAARRHAGEARAS